MLTYGFYNSVNHDRVYNATQLSSMFDGVISDGIFTSVGTGFLVTSSGDATKPTRIRIGTGKAWFDHTWSTNDAVEVMDMPTAAPAGTAWRWDMIALQVDRSSSVRQNSFVWVTGTYGDSPSKPVPAGWASGARTGAELNQYPIAYIKIYGTGHNLYTGIISDSEIDNLGEAKGSLKCPYSTTITTTWDITAHYTLWDGEFHTWLTSAQTSFSTFLTNCTQSFNTFLTNGNTTFNNWMTTKESSFNTWFDTVKGQISGDLGSKLTLAVLTTSTKTIASSDWTAVGSPVNYYTHTVNVTNLSGAALTSDARVEIYLNLGHADYDTANDKIKQYAYIYAAEFNSGRTQIVLYSRALPTVSLPIGFVGALITT